MPPVSAAEHETRLGEIDHTRIDGIEAVDEFARVPRRIVAGYLETARLRASFPVTTVVRSTRLTDSSRMARRSSMARFRL